MIDPFIRGVLAGYGIAIPVGAIAVLIMETAMQRGFRDGAAAGAGAATADLFYAAIAAGAGGIVEPLLAPIGTVLKIISGVVLIALAVNGFLSLRKERSTIRMSGSRTIYMRFLALTILNPLTVVYFAALVLGGVSRGATPANLAAFAIGAFLASLSWQILLAAIGSGLGIALPPVARLATGAIGHTFVFVFGVLILLRALYNGAKQAYNRIKEIVPDPQSPAQYPSRPRPVDRTVRRADRTLSSRSVGDGARRDDAHGNRQGAGASRASATAAALRRFALAIRNHEVDEVAVLDTLRRIDERLEILRKVMRPLPDTDDHRSAVTLAR